jgi:hypothetical protein
VSSIVIPAKPSLAGARPAKFYAADIHTYRFNRSFYTECTPVAHAGLLFNLVYVSEILHDQRSSAEHGKVWKEPLPVVAEK